jgi:DNA invertase Pin-like site-specific DNA recombinase
MTTYAYIRVSTDMQTVENQRDMICARGYAIDEWLCDEATSGTTDWHVRDIFRAVTEGKDGDRIVCAELSRLGRSLRQVLEIVEECRSKGIVLVLVREGIEISDDNPVTKLLVSILGSLSEMERNLISQRTKDALARKKRGGTVLGRPVGRRTDISKRPVNGYELVVFGMLIGGHSIRAIARRIGCSARALTDYISERHFYMWFGYSRTSGSGCNSRPSFIRPALTDGGGTDDQGHQEDHTA